LCNVAGISMRRVVVGEILCVRNQN